MKVGDLVAMKHQPRKILGIVMRIFEVVNLPMHDNPLLVADIMTDDGVRAWKRSKIEVIK